VIVVTVTRKVRRFAGGVCDLGLHVVWCPKYRRRVLGGRVAVRLRELIEQKATEREWEIIALEVMPDHVHLFVKHDAKSSASYVANQFKGFTSRVMREEFPHLKSSMPTLWSSSYFAASVGAVSANTVEKYINTQWERPLTKKGKEGTDGAPRVQVPPSPDLSPGSGPRRDAA
jgi:putative transposase